MGICSSILDQVRLRSRCGFCIVFRDVLETSLRIHNNGSDRIASKNVHFFEILSITIETCKNWSITLFEVAHYYEHVVF